MKELIAIRPSSISGQQINTVNGRDLHTFLEVGKDFSNWIKAQIERARLLENRDYIFFAQKGENTGRGRSSIEYHLTIDAAKHIAMMSGTEKGFEVRDYFLECEKVAQNQALPQSLPEALRMYANEIEQKELALAQRDEAIRTKALIGGKREATAMATASAQTRKANKLEEELGRSTNWKAAKAIPWVLDVFANSKGMWSVLGKKLKNLSDENGIEVRKIESDRFGTVNAYHIDVIDKIRSRLESDENMMGKYRLCEG